MSAQRPTPNDPRPATRPRSRRVVAYRATHAAGEQQARKIVAVAGGAALVLLALGLWGATSGMRPGAAPVGTIAFAPAAAAPTGVSGTPEPTPTPRTAQVLSGAGNQTTEDFNLTSGEARFVMSHKGREAFVVRLLDQAGRPAGGLEGLASELANTIGAWNGDRQVPIAATGRYKLQVTADGAWEVRVQQ